MAKITDTEITAYIEENLLPLHAKKLKKLSKLTLKEILERKNPYLFKAKHVTTASEFMQSVLGAFLSSQEETQFGGFLERLAIFICAKVYRGHKSSATGIDLEFERKNILYIVAIKSGPNWGNAGQIEKLKTNFSKAKRILNTNASKKNVVAVNGCLYGRDLPEDRGDYLKLCGQRFWEFISGRKTLYTDIIEPLGSRAKERKEEFEIELAKVTNRLTKEFLDDFCLSDGVIQWKKIVEFNSSIVPPKVK
ncbi:MAG TPA: PmeII family type II restriction endonuclease [Verrucomicrobiae bacterium]|nr:PmeII family type II restriction endonuclease [Verrucomicrobiae bacterium]